MLLALRTAVEESSAPGRDARVNVVRGEGRAFCSGSDPKWMAESGVLNDAAAHLQNQDRMQAACESLEAARQVVIACVQGYAVAGGPELALSCDIVVADQDAQLGEEHVRKNLFPSGGSTQRLPRRIGAARALYYPLSGRRMSGRKAERIGLAALAVPGAELNATVIELASETAQADSHALASMKLSARRALDVPLRGGLALECSMQLRHRNESPAMVAGVHKFAAGAGASRPTAAPHMDTGVAR